MTADSRFEPKSDDATPPAKPLTLGQQLAALRKPKTFQCLRCGQTTTRLTGKARYCSDACRKLAWAGR